MQQASDWQTASVFIRLLEVNTVIRTLEYGYRRNPAPEVYDALRLLRRLQHDLMAERNALVAKAPAPVGYAMAH